jgi:hypothetical protein
LIGLVEFPKITLAALKGIRQFALAKYEPQLSPADFSRLIFLMRNLAPSIIESGRIDWILDGFPNAQPLFT